MSGAALAEPGRPTATTTATAQAAAARRTQPVQPAVAIPGAAPACRIVIPVPFSESSDLPQCGIAAGHAGCQVGGRSEPGDGAYAPEPRSRRAPFADRCGVPGSSSVDQTPRPLMTGDHVRRRHVWFGGTGGYRRPGLVIAWRRSSGTEWEAHVARVHGDGEVLHHLGAGLLSNAVPS